MILGEPQEGKKFDGGKTRWAFFPFKAAQGIVDCIQREHEERQESTKEAWFLLPWPAVREVVRVLAFGASKYGNFNWQFVPGARRRYYEAAIRHLVEWSTGKSTDDESKLHHLAHAACNVLFLLCFDLGICKEVPESDPVEIGPSL